MCRYKDTERKMHRYRCKLSWQFVFNIFSFNSFTFNYICFYNYEHFVIVGFGFGLSISLSFLLFLFYLLLNRFYRASYLNICITHL